MPLRRLIFLATLAGGLLGCAQRSEDRLYPPIDATAPEVLRSDPADGATQVPLDTRITIWFSKPVDPFTIRHDTLSVSSGDLHLRGEFVVNEVEEQVETPVEDGVEAVTELHGQVVFVPFETLPPNIRFRLKINRAVTDEVGNHLTSEYISEFKTGP
jgi:hypothetical protein